MANPFPGMNPYIEISEDFWTGFHNALITFCSLQLNATLPANWASPLVASA